MINPRKLGITILIVLVLYFSLVGFWTGWYTKRKIIHDIKASTGFNVTIGYSHIYPFTGNGTMKNIRILNPPEFKSKEALSVAEVAFSGNSKSLYSDDIRLNQMQIHGIEVHVDYQAGQSNLSKLAMNASKNYQGCYSHHDTGFKTIRLNQLNLDEITIFLGPTILNHEPPKLRLNPVELHSIGDEQQGESMGNLGIRLGKLYVQNAGELLKSPPPGMNENLTQELNSYLAIAKDYLDHR